MFFLRHKLLFVSCLLSCATRAHSTRHGLSPPPNVTHLTDLFPHLSFDEAFKAYYGGSNIQSVSNGSYIILKLDASSGSGFRSRDLYYYGFFSAAIKLPSSYSAGLVIAFYMSNLEQFPKHHDEIDFELLGHEKQKEWVLQTNVYGNGSVATGREEKFHFWFDPTQDFHEYSILWNYHHIVFLVDNIPVREVNHIPAMSAAYPSKPMSVYATIWDGSDWATHGGKKPINYKFAPYIVSFKDMEISGCMWNGTQMTQACSNKGGNGRQMAVDPVEGEEFVTLSKEQQNGMEWVRERFMFYSYCEDVKRYLVAPPECKAGKFGVQTIS